MTANPNQTQSIVINGEARDVPAPLTVQQLLDHLQVGGRHLAVERNRVIVAKTGFASTEVLAGDRIEIVTFTGGG
jgi:thiamine biosynthesis protein ThiS